MPTSARRDLPDPFSTWPLPAPRVAARRTLSMFGGEVELVLLPERAARRQPRQPLLRPDRAPAILASEALWRSDSPAAVLTPNRYPFATAASILWSAQVEREPGAALLALAIELAEAHGGNVLMNTLGAAATMPRAHLHLTGERRGFLASLPTEPAACDVDLGDVELVQLAAPFPALVLGVRGPRGARACAAARLLELRAAPAVNLVSDGTTTWVAPRRVETPTPHFPIPLGCSELWGRFCYEDEAAFARAEAATLAQALAAALWPRQDTNAFS